MSHGNGRLSSSGSYSITYNLPYWLLKFAKAHSMGELSPSAQQRLSMLEFFYQVKDVSVAARMFKMSRKTLYKWLARYKKSGKLLSSLEDVSKAPLTRRKVQLTFTEEMNIKRLREKYIRLSKTKLQILYRKKHHVFMSQHHIQHVIEKHNLYYDPIATKRRSLKRIKGRGAKKIRINEVNPHDYISPQKPFFFCTDTIVLYLPYGLKRYVLTAIEGEKKIAYARCYTNKSSLSAFDFLMRLNMLVDGRIAAILSDNGSEFLKYFDEACKRLKITHIYSRVNTPKDNAIDERFNRTIQEEFMQVDEFFEPLLTRSTLIEANQRLTIWLIFYNFERPHQTLKYMSPMEWYNHYQLKGVSPMSPSITST